MRRVPVILLADVVAVIAFATAGRRSHNESLDAAGILTTAWPFLAALAVGWAVSRAWRAPIAWATALVVWPATLVGGLVLRLVASDRGVAPAFAVVAAIMLGILLVGWRMVARIAGRADARTEAA